MQALAVQPCKGAALQGKALRSRRSVSVQAVSAPATKLNTKRSEEVRPRHLIAFLRADGLLRRKI